MLFRTADPSGYLPRHLDPALRAALRSFPVVLLDGTRGAGKTTSGSDSFARQARSRRPSRTYPHAASAAQTTAVPATIAAWTAREPPVSPVSAATSCSGAI